MLIQVFICFYRPFFKTRRIVSVQKLAGEPKDACPGSAAADLVSFHFTFIVKSTSGFLWRDFTTITWEFPKWLLAPTPPISVDRMQQLGGCCFWIVHAPNGTVSHLKSVIRAGQVISRWLDEIVYLSLLLRAAHLDFVCWEVTWYSCFIFMGIPLLKVGLTLVRYFLRPVNNLIVKRFTKL